MPTLVTPYLAKKIIDHLFGTVVWTPPADVYMGLFTDIECTVEVTGNGYARKLVAVPAMAADVNSVLSTAQLEYTFMPACTVRGAGLFDAVSTGNKLVTTPLGALAVAVDSTVTYAAGQIVVGLA